MPKYYCDYCDIFLTHDSPSVRRSHNMGWKHINAVRDYYSQLGHHQAQDIIDMITTAHANRGIALPSLMTMTASGAPSSSSSSANTSTTTPSASSVLHPPANHAAHHPVLHHLPSSPPTLPHHQPHFHHPHPHPHSHQNHHNHHHHHHHQQQQQYLHPHHQHMHQLHPRPPLPPPPPSSSSFPHHLSASVPMPAAPLTAAAAAAAAPPPPPHDAPPPKPTASCSSPVTGGPSGGRPAGALAPADGSTDHARDGVDHERNQDYLSHDRDDINDRDRDRDFSRLPLGLPPRPPSQPFAPSARPPSPKRARH